MIKECLVILLLLVVNAFFALSEMAIVSSSKPLLRQWALQGNRRAQIALTMAEDSGRFLSTVQVGITLVGILAGAYGGATIAERLTPLFNRLSFINPHGDTVAVILVVGLITYFSVVIGELMPKQLALQNSEKWALRIAYPMRVIAVAATPVVTALESSGRYFMQILGLLSSDEETITQAEVKAVIAEGVSSGLIEKDENDMLHTVLDLGSIAVASVMTHRKNIEMLDATLPTSELIDKALASQYTRIPLYQDSTENIIGVLHTKVLARQVRHVRADDLAIDLSSAISEPWFIPETTDLLEQLQAFRERREHFALVVDEYGSLLGMITREDILEEIVGRVQDADAPHQTTTQKENGVISLVVEGGKTIRELNREFDWDLPDDAYATVAGLLLYETRSLPEVGQSFDLFGFHFEILERQRHQIALVRVTKHA